MAAPDLPPPARRDHRPGGQPFATRSEVIARRGMAATSHPLATQTALDLLKRGGSALDAALAANAMLAVVEPTGCGLGGDLFALVWEAKSRKVLGFNGSGRSPAALTIEHFTRLGRKRVPARGPLSISAPGCVDAWWQLHGRLGTLPWSEVLAPAIATAGEGFPVSEVIAAYWGPYASPVAGEPGFAEIFLPSGRSPRKGEIFRNPGLAATLGRIAAGGRDAFYQGELATRIAGCVRDHGGLLSEEDLAATSGEWVEPISATYRGHEVWELPPNTQGATVLQMLNLLEGFDLAGMGFGSADHLHHLVEAKKLAFADRARFYGDPVFDRIPLPHLISRDYADARRGLIDPTRAAQVVEPGNPALNGGDTVYLAVADAAGNLVSLIQSNFRGFGSGVCPPGLGFSLQNRGELFTLEPGHPNALAPRKRPFHTIIPAMVTREGEPWLSFGVMGADMQPQGHAQILVNLLDFGMNLQEAGDAPRVLHEGSATPTGDPADAGGTVFLEDGFSEETRLALRARGHTLGQGSVSAFGGYQAILRDLKNQTYIGASESRKDGQAAGY